MYVPKVPVSGNTFKINDLQSQPLPILLPMIKFDQKKVDIDFSVADSSGIA